MRARIQTEIDTRRLAVEARAAARQIAQQERIRLQIEVDQAQAQREIQARIRAAVAGLRATVVLDVAVDTAAAQARLQELTRDRRVSLDVDTDGLDRARRLADGIRGALGGLAGGGGLSLNLGGNALSGVSTLLTKLGTLPMMAGGITLLAGAAINLGGALFAVGAAAAQSVGVLAALPGLATMAAQGIGVLIAGFKGVSEAVSALGAAEKASGADAQAHAQAVEQAAQAVEQAAENVDAATAMVRKARERLADVVEAVAERIQDAEQRVADAFDAAHERIAQVTERAAEIREAVQERITAATARLADVQEAAAERYAAAERTNARAAESAQLAQEGLNEARRAAVERLEDLKLSLSGASLDEEGAALAVERARQRLSSVNDSVTSTDLDKREADLAYRQALQRLEESKERLGDLREDQARADAEGVEGSDSVEAAKRRLRDANEALRDSEEAIARAQADGAQAIADAQAAITEARKEGAAAIAEAEEAVAEAKKDAAQLIQEAQEALNDVRKDGAEQVKAANEQLKASQDQLKDSQEQLQKAQEAAAAAATQQSAAQTQLADAMANLTPAGRAFAEFIAGTLMPRLTDLRRAIQDALLPHIQAAVEKGLPFLDTLETALVGTADVIGGVAEDLGDLLADDQFNTDMAEVFDTNNAALERFGAAAVNVLSMLRSIMLAAGPLVEAFSAWVEELTAAGDAYLRSEPGFNRFQSFLEGAADTTISLKNTLRDLTMGIIAIGSAAVGSGEAGTEMLASMEDGAAAFRAWAEDEATQARLTKFFDGARELLGRIGESLGGVIELFGHLGEATGGDTLFVFFDILDAIVGALDKLIQMPGTIPVLVAVTTLGVAGAGLGLAAKVLGLLVAPLSLLAKIPAFGGWIVTLLAGLKTNLVTAILTRFPTPVAVLAGIADWLQFQVLPRIPGIVLAAVKGAGIGLIGMLLGGLIDDDQGGARDAVGTGLKGAGIGATIGGIIGSLLGPIGTGLGAAIGAAIGGILGVITGGEWWGAIGRFFTETIPAFLMEQAAALPGRVGALLRGATGLVQTVVGWIGDQITQLPDRLRAMAAGAGDLASSIGGFISDAVARLPSLLGNAGAALLRGLVFLVTQVLPDLAATIITELPSLILELVTAIPGLFLKALATGIKIWAWVLTELVAIIPEIMEFCLTLPFKIFDWVVRAVVNSPKLFAYIADQLVEWGREAPGIIDRIWEKLKEAFAIGSAKLVRAMREKLAEFSQVFIDLGADLYDLGQELWGKLVDLFGEWRDKLVDVFKKLPGGVQDALKLIGNVIRVPVQIMLDVGYNKTVRWLWNEIAGLVGSDHKLPEIKIPQFAEGGVVGPGQYGVLPGYSPGRDTMLAAVSPGEAWLRPEIPAALGSRFVHGLNGAAVSGGVSGVRQFVAAGGMRFGLGGIVGDGLSWIGDQVKDLFPDGLRNAAADFLNPVVDAIQSELSGTAFGRLIGNIPVKIVRDFLDWLVDKEDDIVGNSAGMIRVARGELGQGEEPAGSDNTKYGRWYGINPAAWCDMFISWVADKAKTTDAVGRFSYTPSHLAAMRAKGREITTGPARPGDLAFLTSGGTAYHIGLVEQGGSGGITTIEGNHSTAVQRVSRNRSGVVLTRPAYAEGGVVGPDHYRISPDTAGGFARTGRAAVESLGIGGNALVAPWWPAGTELALSAGTRTVRAVVSAADNTAAFLRRTGPNILAAGANLLADLGGPRAASWALSKMPSQPIRHGLYDNGGPLKPGLSLISNQTGKDEWVLTPEAVDRLGGGEAVAALNAGTVYQSRRGASPVAVNAVAPDGRPITINVYALPHHSEEDIADIVRRKLGGEI
ncbi:hypothetical protein GCM10022221_68680 [Actinocorallia aurea]